MSKRVSDVGDYVKRQFGDESGVQITDDDILRWVNMGQQDLAFIAKAIQGTATTAYAAGQTEYVLPTEKAIEITSIRVDGRPIKGVEFQVAESLIVDSDPTASTSAKYPDFWWRWGNTINFWPKPTTESDGLEIKVYYIGTPETLVDQSDFLGLPDKYFEALTEYVLSKAYELDEDVQSATGSYQRYMDRLGQSFEEDKAENLFYPVLSFVED